MTRLLVITLLLCSTAAAASHLMVLARKNVPAGGGFDVMEETFEASPFDNAGSYTEDDAEGDVDPDHGTTVYAGSRSMEILVTTSGTNHFARYDHGASSGITDYYYRVWVYLPSGQTSGDIGYAFQADDTTTGIGAADDISLRLRPQDGQIVQYYITNTGITNATLDTWHYIEGHYPTGDWKLDGTNCPSTTADATPNDFRYLKIGGGTGGPEDGDFYIDNIAVDTTGWIGP